MTAEYIVEAFGHASSTGALPGLTLNVGSSTGERETRNAPISAHAVSCLRRIYVGQALGALLK